MAKKSYYSIDEVSEMLGRDVESVKALVREGKLREFRDAGKVFYRADDVDKLRGGAAAKEDTGEITLEAADDELPSLADAAGTGTSMLGLEPLGDEPEQKKKKEGTVITSSGIGVFDDDELEIEADPMAKTTITTGAGDQVSLEGSGSGSGLLDLTRESDDTSLGAELLDEIYPGEEETVAAPTPARAEKRRTPEPEPEPEPAYEAPVPMEPLAPVMARASDPAEGIMSGLLAGALVLLAIAGSVVAGVLQGFVPDYGRWLSNNFYLFLGGSAGLMVLALLIGWLLGKAAAAPRR